MKQLHKHGLKVIGYDFVAGRSCLESVMENDDRRYPLNDEINLMIYTNQGTLTVVTSPGFIFDGRSGPKIVDWYAPNLGTLEERICWFAHDGNGYGLDLSFEDTNILLFAMLRDLARYRKSKAEVIQLAVSLSRSWYGEPKEGDWCRANVGKVRTVWMPKTEAA
ncbi:hypothetical protein [Fibrobacter sp.]|uniref:hypothetical protein n=1 Tax=Fibrobacter sp. TaxID=35828 RepID=UPI003862FA83